MIKKLEQLSYEEGLRETGLLNLREEKAEMDLISVYMWEVRGKKREPDSSQ